MATVWLIPIEEYLTVKWSIWLPSEKSQYIGKGPHLGLFHPGANGSEVQIVDQQSLAHKWSSPKSALLWALSHGYNVKALVGIKYTNGNTYIRVEINPFYIDHSKEKIAKAIKAAIEDTHPAVAPDPGCEITFGFAYTQHRGNYLWDYCKFKRIGDKIVPI